MMPSCALKRASAFLLPVTRFGGFSFLEQAMVSVTVILAGVIGGISGGYVSSVLTNAYRDWRGNKVNVAQTQLTGHVRAEVCSGDACNNDPDFMAQKNDELIQRIKSFNEKHQLFINGDGIKQLNTEERRLMSVHLAMILCEVTKQLKATDMPAEKCSGGVYKSHVDRMVNERDQLSQRIEKLQAFIDGDKFKQLDAEERLRMENQLVAMNLYLHALAGRLEAVGKTKQ